MRSQGPPTARQIYALAAALCEQADEPFPETLAEASAQLERLRTEIGHPAPHLVDCPPRRRSLSRESLSRDSLGRDSPGRGSFRRGKDLLASEVAAHLARELR